MRDLEHFKNKTGRSDNIKYSQIRKYRKASTPADLTYREVHMIKGSVWSIHDRDVPFEGGAGLKMNIRSTRDRLWLLKHLQNSEIN